MQKRGGKKVGVFPLGYNIIYINISRNVCFGYADRKVLVVER